MNKPDEAIDKALAGLRDTEPSAGLERRILEGLEHRATQRWNWTSALNWVAAGGFAVAMLTISIIAALHRPSPVIEPNLPSVHSPQSTVARASSATLANTSRGVKRTRRTTVRRDAFPPPLLMAASFPAPPMPLTEQEKLLLQVAGRGENSPAPTLDPDQLARREAEAEAAFEASLGTFPDAAAQDVEPRIPEVDRKGESQ
jgi:hypothetical protein